MTNEQLLEAYRVLHDLLDRDHCDDADILSALYSDTARRYKEATGVTVGVALGWSKQAEATA